MKLELLDYLKVTDYKDWVDFCLWKLKVLFNVSLLKRNFMGVSQLVIVLIYALFLPKVCLLFLVYLDYIVKSRRLTHCEITKECFIVQSYKHG